MVENLKQLDGCTLKVYPGWYFKGVPRVVVILNKCKFGVMLF